jgi:hypothetical protein
MYASQDSVLLSSGAASALPLQLHALLANLGAPPGPSTALPGLTPASSVAGAGQAGASGSAQAAASPMDIDGGNHQVHIARAMPCHALFLHTLEPCAVPGSGVAGP